MPHLDVDNICRSYPDGWTLADINFSVRQGESVCLLGPSGCGKTTLLRLIAGLEQPECGQIRLDGEDVTGIPSHERGFGLMFQEYALFPHKDVFGNVAFGLRMQGLDRRAVVERVAEVLDLVGLAGFEHRDVNELSGGERQRVALARSLAPRPTLLMLDEPLGALDRTLRERLMVELPRILRQAHVTAITVTHDQEEAFAIADRVVLMREGRIVQMGPPQEVYRRPVSAWAAQFLGLTNLVKAQAVGDNRVETPIGVLRVSDEPAESPALAEASAELLIRPEAARCDGTGPNIVQGILTRRSFRGDYYQFSVRHATGVELTFSLPATVTLPAEGDTIVLSLDPRALTLLHQA
jgi:ABC-type Fe3+/spermidine/putrescine transport system ATPase subunit